MKTDEEIEALEKRVTEWQAECLRWSERWKAHITGAFRAMEERAQAAETRLLEAEARISSYKEEIRDLLRKLDAARERAETAACAKNAVVAGMLAMLDTHGRMSTETAEDFVGRLKRELDAARAALESAARAFVSVWAALGDPLLARGPVERAYVGDVAKKCRDAERACRAALGEKP